MIIAILLLFQQTMVQMNKVTDPQKTMQTMQQFEKESAKMEMTEEMSKTFFFKLVKILNKLLTS